MIKIISIILTIICSYCVLRLYENLKHLENENKDLEQIIIELQDEINLLKFEKAKEDLSEKNN